MILVQQCSIDDLVIWSNRFRPNSEGKSMNGTTNDDHGDVMMMMMMMMMVSRQ